MYFKPAKWRRLLPPVPAPPPPPPPPLPALPFPPPAASGKEGRITFNSRSIGGDRGTENIARVLEMLGVFERESTEKTSDWPLEKAKELHRLVTAKNWDDFPGLVDEEKRVSLRFIVFARKGAELADVRKHITLERVLAVVRQRMEPGGPCSEYRTAEDSRWKGLAGKIVRALDLGHRRRKEHIDLDELIAHVSELCFRGAY